MLQNIVNELESTAKYALTGDDNCKRVAAIIYSLLGSIKGESLQELLEVTHAFSLREKERLMILINAQDNGNQNNPS